MYALAGLGLAMALSLGAFAFAGRQLDTPAVFPAASVENAVTSAPRPHSSYQYQHRQEPHRRPHARPRTPEPATESAEPSVRGASGTSNSGKGDPGYSGTVSGRAGSGSGGTGPHWGEGDDDGGGDD
jgi:hypothetical protein